METYCTYCDSPADSNSLYCPYCGHEVLTDEWEV